LQTADTVTNLFEASCTHVHAYVYRHVKNIPPHFPLDVTIYPRPWSSQPESIALVTDTEFSKLRLSRRTETHEITQTFFFQVLFHTSASQPSI